MRIRLSPLYTIAFLLLTIVMMELHEIVHIVTGRLICGCWGSRDFNVWSLCDTCAQTHTLYWLATLAGPLFSFGIMWIGMFLLSSKNLRKRALGFSLIFSNIPFGRISQTIKGAGDEMTVARTLLGNNITRTETIIICSLIVLALGLPPIFKAYKILTNKRPWLYSIGFLTLPILFILVYLLIGLNSILSTGFLSETWIMGTPVLITLHTLIAIILLLLLRKNLLSFDKINQRTEN